MGPMASKSQQSWRVAGLEIPVQQHAGGHAALLGDPGAHLTSISCPMSRAVSPDLN